MPAVLALVGYLFTRSENHRTQKLADQRAEEDQNLANDRREVWSLSSCSTYNTKGKVLLSRATPQSQAGL